MPFKTIYKVTHQKGTEDQLTLDYTELQLRSLAVYYHDNESSSVEDIPHVDYMKCSMEEVVDYINEMDEVQIIEDYTQTIKK